MDLSKNRYSSQYRHDNGNESAIKMLTSFQQKYYYEQLDAQERRATLTAISGKSRQAAIDWFENEYGVI